MTNPKATQADSILAKTFNFSLKDGFVIDGQPGFTLMPFDEVYVRKSPGYFKQQNVTIEGEVQFAGTYTLTSKNERLSDLFRKAGGGTDLAYIPGARLERKVNEAERLRMIEMIKKHKEDNERLLQEMSMNSGRSIGDLGLQEKMQEATSEATEDEIPETYSVGIELDKAISKPGSDADIVLREGDHIFIPSYNGTVKINGEVMYPNSVAYDEGKSAKYYIKQAGGYNRYAKKKQAYIIYMNGTIAKVSDGAKVRPGCEIMVPSKAINRKMTTSETLAIGTSVASVATMIATLATMMK